MTRAKWTGRVAQVAELLLCKCKSLSSNPIPPKKKKNQQKYPMRTNWIYGDY
jgi:hypothetical protein